LRESVLTRFNTPLQGHQGHFHHHGHSHHHSTGSESSTTTLDAERADRISRLAGLERVTTVRQGTHQSHLVPGTGHTAQQLGYFDNTLAQVKERSTVGSASATGSIGGRTTWASESDAFDPDKMSEDHDDGVSSTDGFSDEGNASLVGFGETASSTISGPVSTAAGKAPAARQGVGSPSIGKASAVPPYLQQHHGSSPMSGFIPSGQDAKMIDGMTYDANVVDTAARSPRPVHGPGAEAVERIMRDGFNDDDNSRRPMESPDERGQGLGKFPFEEK
jgi:hypothetical protein